MALLKSKWAGRAAAAVVMALAVLGGWSARGPQPAPQAAPRAALAAVAADQTQPLYPEDFPTPQAPNGAIADANGPNGGGTDNGPSIQAALMAGQATGRPVVLGRSGQHYGVATTIAWHGGVGQELRGQSGGRRGPVDAARGTWLWWTGAANGRLIELYGMNCAIGGLGLGCSFGTSLDRLVDIDNPAGLKIPYITTTEHLLINCHFEAGYGPAVSGCVVGESNVANNEFHRWQGCRFSNFTGAAVNCHAGNGQAKGWQVADCDFIGCGQGFLAHYGSCSPNFTDCNFTSCGMAARWDNGGYEPVSFVRCISENCPQFLYAWGVSSVAIRDCRLAPNAAPATRPPLKQEWIVGGNDTLIEHCQFDSPTPGFYIRPTDGGTVTLLGQNFYSPYLPLAVDTPPRFSVAAITSSYWTGTKLLPNSYWRQDNLPVAGSLPVSQLAPLTVPPAAPAP